MSDPTTFEFAQIKIGDGGGPETFTVVCGLQNVTINETASTNDRFVRDCTAPATPPKRKVTVSGVQWDVTGGGVANTDQFVALKALLGKLNNYEIVGLDISDPATPAGTAIGTFAGSAVMTAKNISTSENDLASMEITLAGEGDLVYTPV